MSLWKVKLRNNYGSAMDLGKLHYFIKLREHSQLKHVKAVLCGLSIEIHSDEQCKRLFSNNMNRIKYLWKISDFLEAYQMIIRMR